MCSMSSHPPCLVQVQVTILTSLDTAITSYRGGRRGCFRSCSMSLTQSPWSDPLGEKKKSNHFTSLLKILQRFHAVVRIKFKFLTIAFPAPTSMNPSWLRLSNYFFLLHAPPATCVSFLFIGPLPTPGAHHTGSCPQAFVPEVSSSRSCKAGAFRSFKITSTDSLSITNQFNVASLHLREWPPSPHWGLPSLRHLASETIVFIS